MHMLILVKICTDLNNPRIYSCGSRPRTVVDSKNGGTIDGKWVAAVLERRLFPNGEVCTK